MRRTVLGILVYALFSFAAQPAVAHQSSVSYSHVRLAGGAIDYELKLSSKDLFEAVGLESDRDATDAEILGGKERLDTYVRERVKMSADGKPCELALRDLRVLTQNDRFAALRYGVRCPDGAAKLRLEYNLFFDLDPRHNGLLTLTRGEKTITQPDLSRPTADAPEANVREWDLGGAGGDAAKGHLDWIVEGMMHIYTGYDHIAFLLALLLVAAIRRRGADGTWEARSFRDELVYVLEVVTAFTIGHSATLIPAALGVFSLPGRFVESAIAASIIYVAVENILHEPRNRWALAMGFGIIHGFGFAGVLSPLLPPTGVVVPLLELNVGVELGQLSIVVVVLPLLIATARANPAGYRRFVVVGGSAIIALSGLIWLIERVAGVELISQYLG